MDIELPLDFKEFLKLLNENGVRYLLIGDIWKVCSRECIQNHQDMSF
jgi:hypothetical protein